MNTMDANKKNISVTMKKGFGKEIVIPFDLSGLTQIEQNWVMQRLLTGQGGNKNVSNRFDEYAAMYNRQLVSECAIKNRSCNCKNFMNLLIGLYKNGRISNRASVTLQIIWEYFKHMCGSEAATKKLNEDLVDILDFFCPTSFTLTETHLYEDADAQNM